MKGSFEKVLNFVDVYFISLGFIIGAGIYSLLSIVTKYSGNFSWLSFLIGGFISLMTAFSYYDLSKKYNSNASEYEYFTDIFGDKFKYGYIFLLIMFSLLTASVLLIVFANILISAIGKESLGKNSSIQFLIQLITIGIVIICNIIDIKFISDLNFYVTCLEIGFLILLILCALYWNLFIVSNKKSNIISTSNEKYSISNQGIMYGAFLSILAFTGFEGIPKLTEETINSSETIPNAIKYSVMTVIIIYSLVSISINSVLGVSQVIKYSNPISKFFEYLFGTQSLNMLNIVSLLSVFNTIILTNTFSSRTIQSISAKGELFDILKNINEKYKTPVNAVIVSGFLVLLLSSSTNVELNLYITNILTFIIFILVNLSAILHKNNKDSKDSKVKDKKDKKEVDSIGLFKKDYSYIGLMSSILMLCHSF
jgi:amino acid transporter